MRAAASVRNALVEVGPSLVTDGGAAEAAEPGPTVPAQTLTALNPTSADASLDPALAQSLTAAWQVVSRVNVELGRAPARRPLPLANGRHDVDQILEGPAAVQAAA